MGRPNPTPRLPHIPMPHSKAHHKWPAPPHSRQLPGVEHSLRNCPCTSQCSVTQQQTRECASAAKHTPLIGARAWQLGQCACGVGSLGNARRHAAVLGGIAQTIDLPGGHGGIRTHHHSPLPTTTPASIHCPTQAHAWALPCPPGLMHAVVCRNERQLFSLRIPKETDWSP